MFEGKRYWLVGASEGIGAELAQLLDAAGASVIISARNRDRLVDLAAQMSPRTSTVPLDVTSAAEIKAAVEQVGQLDGVIYMAGQYTPMTAQAWDSDAAMQVTDVNFLGCLRLLGALVPQFLQRNHGHVVLIGSLAGYTGLPGAIGYGASKAAMMHLGQDLRADCRGTNVRVQVINPGFVKTRLTDKNSFQMPFIMSADSAANRIMKAMQKRRFSHSFPFLFSWYFKLRKIWDAIRG